MASGLRAGFWDHPAAAHLVRNGFIVGSRQSGLDMLVEVTNLGLEVSQCQAFAPGHLNASGFQLFGALRRTGGPPLFGRVNAILHPEF